MTAPQPDSRRSSGSTAAAPATGQRNGAEPDPPRGTGPGEQPQQDPAAGKQPLKRSTRIGLTVIAVLTVVAILGFGGTYLLYSRNYVTTDNAQVDGDQIEINSPISGKLVYWRATEGAVVRKNEVVGRVQMRGSGAQPQEVIRAPGDGTVGLSTAVAGSWVSAGANLATAYDFDGIYATARVDETDVGDVRPGARVDISVDTYPGTAVTGYVQEVKAGAAGVFSLFPEANSTGNFQKVTQVIPVKITFTNTGGLRLVPGMSITVHIHKQ